LGLTNSVINLQAPLKGVYLKQQRAYRLLNNCFTENVPVYRKGKGKDDWTCSMYARFEYEKEIKSKFLTGKTTSDLRVDGMIILKCTLKHMRKRD